MNNNPLQINEICYNDRSQKSLFHNGNTMDVGFPGHFIYIKIF
uniref:Uncharacterized protein n=1 Tax=Anguilla anguilla TaxID=7936 RepID=A0A0E9XEH9_ANGAN